MLSKSESLLFLLLVYFFGSVFVLTPLSSNAETSGKTSTKSMKQEYSPVYQAIEEAEEALRALRENHPDQATQHADKAVSKAQVRSRSGDTTGMSPEQTKQLADGLTSLETAVGEAKQGKRQLTEEDIIRTLVEWLGEKGCKEGHSGHGDGCQLNGAGGCLIPGQQPCNRFQPWKKCTNYAGACYCM